MSACSVFPLRGHVIHGAQPLMAAPSRLFFVKAVGGGGVPTGGGGGGGGGGMHNRMGGGGGGGDGGGGGGGDDESSDGSVRLPPYYELWTWDAATDRLPEAWERCLRAAFGDHGACVAHPCSVAACDNVCGAVCVRCTLAAAGCTAAALLRDFVGKAQFDPRGWFLVTSRCVLSRVQFVFVCLQVYLFM